MVRVAPEEMTILQLEQMLPPREELLVLVVMLSVAASEERERPVIRVKSTTAVKVGFIKG
jgi:hypothetical protein